VRNVRGRASRGAYVLHERVRAALATVFGVHPDVIARIRVVEHSRYARWHGRHTAATTRRGVIYLRESGARFAADRDLVLHEYFHVIRQWNGGALTIPRYVAEHLRRGYRNNRFEVEARAFARENAARYERLLDDDAVSRP
jgi:hypothetical protein